MEEHIDLEDLIAFHLDLLEDEKEKLVEQHLNHCEACTEELNAMQAIDVDLKGLPQIQPSENFAVTIARAFEQQKAASFPWFNYLLALSFLLCAAVLLVSWNPDSQAQLTTWWNIYSGKVIQLLWIALPVAFLYGLDTILKRRIPLT